MELFLFTLLSLLLGVSLIFLIYGFSTPFVQAGLLFIYILISGKYLGWWSFIIVLLAAIAAEAIEFFSGMRGAQKAQGSRRSSWGAIGGGLFGAIVFSPVLFPVGSILGSFLGTFFGAFLLESTSSKDSHKAFKVGWWATIGKMVGFATKISISVGIFVGVTLWGLGKMVFS